MWSTNVNARRRIGVVAQRRQHVTDPTVEHAELVDRLGADDEHLGIGARHDGRLVDRASARPSAPSAAATATTAEPASGSRAWRAVTTSTPDTSRAETAVRSWVV